MDLIMEWLPWVALTVGAFVDLVGLFVALPAILFPLLEVIALPMAIGGLCAAIWGGHTIYLQRQLDKAQARYLAEYHE